MSKFSKFSPRIQVQIKALHYKSELLVASAQLGVIILLLIINHLTPAGYSPNAPVKSAQLGLFLFAILALLRLWFAITKQINSFFLGFSAIAEIVLLLFIIWTYHLQYETSAAVNLKNTQFDYIFVLIALRALRFEPIWIILSGLTAAIGWIIIVWAALNSAGMNAMTWDYVTYASTHSIYLGAEFNRVLSILLVTASIALGVQQAKKLLFQAVSHEIAENDLSHFFDSAVAKKIISSETALQAGHGETRQAAILFTDIRGFTSASKILPPPTLIKILGEYQRLLVPIIQKHNGVIDKFLGDGIMATFGALTPSNTYAADALNAIEDMIAAIQDWKKIYHRKGIIDINVGLSTATGEIIFGVIGNEGRLEYTVIGETANLAAKLEKQNKKEHTQALTTSASFKLALSQGYKNLNKKQLHHCAIDGIDYPIDLVVLG